MRPVFWSTSVPVSSQVSAATTTTVPSVMPVFCTTESIVIGPWSSGVWVAGVPGEPGAPTDHVEGWP